MIRVVAGDIGGTHCRLMLAQTDAARVEINYQQTYRSREFDDFDAVLQRFLDETEASAEAACFAVAGPIRAQQASLTNLPWELDSMQLTSRFAIPRISLINDFAANGYSLAVLDEADYRVLQVGESQPGNRLILGAGTGLGMALITDCHDELQVLASEGGHMDFAPADEAQHELHHYLRQQSQRISYEQVLSGPGLVRLYRYQAWRSGSDEAPVINAPDPPAEVSQRALDGDPVAGRALQLFFRIYGSCAGNLALVGLASGGVYLAGGIAVKLADALADSDFLAAFNDKAPMQPLLAAMPVKLITNPHAGLLGAAWYAGNK